MTLLTDLRRAFRTLRSNPSLTLAAILALAIGIGANTTLFSVVDAVLLKPLNYPQADRIVELTRHYPGFDAWAVTPTKFDFWRTQSQSFSALAATSFLPTLVNFTGSGTPERVSALHVTSGYSNVFGAVPVEGRFFNQQEDRPNAGNYAVLTYGFWARRFGKDPAVVGRSLSLGGASYTVLGIMPPGFTVSPSADLLLPLQLHVDPADRGNDYHAIGRLKPGVSIERAREDMKRVRDELRNQYGKDVVGDKESIGVYRYQDWLTRGVRPALVVLAFAVAFVLLIACANVANLLLARSAGRQHEIAIRTALGASAPQIIRQLLMESLVLSGIGAAAGVLLANLTLPFVLAWAPADLPQAARIQIDWRVLAFAAAVAVATGLLFGLFPALQSARLGIQNPLRDSGTRTATSGTGKWVRQSLVVFEVAISLVLLIGAGLLLRTFVNLSGVQPGFDPRNVITMLMSIDDTRLAGTRPVAQMVERVQTRVESLNGITDAGATSTLPLHQGSDLPFVIVGRKMKPDDLPDERIRYISPHYFSVMRMRLVGGRSFTAKDTLDSPRVIIVNEAFVRKYFPRAGALGERVLVGATMGPIFNDQPREIVGVVSDTREVSLSEPPDPVLFEPLAQVPDTMVRAFVKMMPLHWVIRTAHDPMAFAESVRREALVASGGIPLADPQPLKQYVGDSISQQRFLMSLLAVFAGLAVFLGAIGIYGVISYGVAQRTRELGIRSALGAARTDLVQLVIREGMTMAGVGLVVGLIAAFGLTRFLESMLYGVSPTEPATVAAVTALLALVALLACFIPARRAAGVDPVIALRQE
jgi:putative ABC transport system permease protein